jgi:hypothetical protein
MISGINSRQPNDSRTPLASILENNRPAAFYYILYMIVMTFILLQLFVGFVIVTFQEVGVKTFRKTKLDRNQVLREGCKGVGPGWEVREVKKGREGGNGK